MRDPELVFKAQLAASALERAWQHWRVIHGQEADPMPAISSYVGYSLEEPWGQPRVVFGLAAADAEQLAALLERHDCIGPSHAMTAAKPGSNEMLADAGGIAGRPLPVPPQAPSLHAEPKISGDVYRTAGIRPGVSQPDNEDGPVYRQLAAALRAARDVAVVETLELGAAERDSAGQEPPIREPAVQEPAIQEPTVQEPPAGQEPVVQEAAAQEPAVQEPPAGQEPVVQEAAAQEPAVQEQPTGQDQARSQQAREEQIREEPAAQEPAGLADGETGEVAADHDNAGSRGGSKGSDTDRDGGDGGGGRAADTGGSNTDSRTSSKGPTSRTGDSGGPNRGPGKNDGSAASPRKAVGRRAGAGRSTHSRSAASRAGTERGGDGADADGPGPDAGTQDLTSPPTSAGADVLADRDADEANSDSESATQSARRLGPLALAASAARIAAEARIRAAARQASPSAEVAGTDSGDIAAVWGGPGLARGDEEPEVVRFWPWSQSAADAESDPEPGPSAAEPQDYPQATNAWRDRIARGYSIPRLSRTKRPGAVSGP